MNVSPKEVPTDQEQFWQPRNNENSVGYTSPTVYLKPVLKNLLPILLTVAACTGLAYLYAEKVTPLYKASSTILVEPQRANIIDVKDGLERFGRNQLQTQLQILESRSVMTRVVDILNLVGEAPHDKPLTVDSFDENLTVKAIPDTNLIQIGFVDSDPVQAALGANLLAKQYIDADLEARRRQLGESTEILNTRLQSMQSNLRASENRLLEFKKERGLLDLDNRLGKLDEQVMRSATDGLTNARIELARLNSERNSIEAARKTAGNLGATLSAKKDPTLIQLYSQRSQLQSERRELQNKYGDKHPKIVDINSRLNETLKQIKNNENRISITIDAEYDATLAAIAEFENTLEVGRQSILGMGESLQDLEALEQEVSTNKETFLVFLKSLKETSSTQGLEASIGRITEYAHAPAQPWKPQKELILLFAALGSFVIASLFAIVRNLTSDRVTNLRVLESKFNVPVIGYTPLRKISSSDTNQGRFDEREVRIYNEALRSIRSRLLATDGPLSNRVIGITSTYGNEGKTTLAKDLALSISTLKRTLLIDCDLRKPSLMKKFGVEDQPFGLTDLIKGEAPASQCIITKVEGSLDLLTSGSPNEHQAGELLLTKNFSYLIEKLSQNYEKIIIDCPPLTAVSDPLIIGRNVSSIILVVKVPSKITHKAISESLHQLRQADIPVGGIVATHLKPGKLHEYNVAQDYSENYGYTSPNYTPKQLPDDLIALDNSNRKPKIDINTYSRFRSGMTSQRKYALDKESKAS